MPARSSRRSKPVRLLVLSGPNLDRLGRREPSIYGRETLAQVHALIAERARSLGAAVDCRQSNHEGELIDWIGAARDDGFAGLIFNPGAYTHTSYALYDAIRGAELPTIEVHLSNPDAREEFRRTSVIAPAVAGRIAGFGADSYLLAVDGLLSRLNKPRKR